MTKSWHQQLEEANKLIFVKQYTKAEAILRSITDAQDVSGRMLVHLRSIELASRLGKLEAHYQHYLERQAKNPQIPEWEMCLILCEQMKENHSTHDCIRRFQEYLKAHGDHPAAFYGIGFSLESQQTLDRAAFNYEKSLALDSTWYPSYFGLSQIAYHQGNEKRGDHYFFQFESAAPYNVYGNFETHRKLSKEFLEREMFVEAEAAIRSLTEWWQENKGYCPTEIEVHEKLALARISAEQGDPHQADVRHQQAKGLAKRILHSESSQDGVLYFTARVLEEFGESELAFQLYKKILKVAGTNPQIVQKVGGHFLSHGDYARAFELFEEAYHVHPDNPEIRFCRLVTHLKKAKVNVEDYLIAKERLRQLVANQGDRVEILSLLHSLLARFADDGEVHARLGEVYQRLGNVEKASRHFSRMHELDPLSRKTRLRFAAFMMQHGNIETAMSVLGEISAIDGSIEREEKQEMEWLKATYHLEKRNYRAAIDSLNVVIASDPWNVSFVVKQAICLTHLAKERLGADAESISVDATLEKLNRLDEKDISWVDFSLTTQACEAKHLYDLAYARRKLHFLYTNGEERALNELVLTAVLANAARGTFELMRLLNTNFDSATIYLALGKLCKELWQLETATFWFEQMLQYPGVDDGHKSKAYLELADCLVWRSQQLQRAIEYAKLAQDMTLNDPGETREQAMIVLGHAALKSGHVRQAQSYLEQFEAPPAALHLEASYLKGLVQYRNGDRNKANEIWKPLLTAQSSTLRIHHIKQEILKYYFDGAPYNHLKAN